MKDEVINDKATFFDRIILFSLRNRGIVVGLSTLLLIIGTYFISTLNIDVFPNLNRPVVTVLVEAHGLAPREVETLVTIPLEAAINGATGVRKIRSVSKRGISMLQVEFDWGTNIYINRQVISEKISTAENNLPPDIKPVLGPISSIMGEIQLIGIHSKTGETSIKEIRTLADWTLQKRLLSISGVSNVIVIGGEAKEYHILIDSNKLANRNISFSEVHDWLSNLSSNTSGGFLEKDGQEYIIRNIGKVYDISEIESAVVGYFQGYPVRVKDIAKVKIGHKVKRGDAGINANTGVILAIQKEPNASTITLSKKIDEIMKMTSESLPKDLVVTPHLFRQADFIQKAIDNVKEAILDGSIIVIIILFLFLWNFRTTFIILLALPLSLITGVLVLQLFGFGINTMTLGGLTVAIGLLVDDAIVDTENIFRRLRGNWSLPEPRSVIDVVFRSSSEIRNIIILSTLVVIGVFIPLLFLGGVEGRLFQPLVAAFIFALVSSTIVALTLTPVLCSYLLPETTQKLKQDSLLVRAFKKVQKTNLTFLLDKPLVSFAIILVLFSASIIIFPFLGKDFLPPFNEGTLTLEVITPAGTSLSKSIQKAKEVEQICVNTKGVKNVSRRTGRSENDEHAEGVHYSELDVTLETENSGLTQREITASLRKQFNELKDVAVNVGQPISHRLDHLLSGIKAEVAIFIYGADLEALMQHAYQVESIVKDIPGVTDLLIETQRFSPELKVSILHDMASKYGVPTGQLTETLEQALSGHVVGRMIEKEKIFNIRVWLNEDSRENIRKLNNFVIKYLPNGEAVTLGKLAEVYEGEGPTEIKREMGSRRIVVQFNVSGEDLGSVVDKIDERLKKDLQLSSGYHYELGGRYASQRKATFLILLLGIASLILIIGLIYVHFNSIILTVQILLNIPLSFIGGVFALLIMDVNLSIASLVGFIALAGIASRNGLMMVSHFLHLMKEEGEAFSKKMVIRGALERLVPVMMTTFTAIFALIPVLITGSDSAGKEILYPVSLVIVGGLVSSTLLDLIITPVAFYRLGKRFNGFMDLKIKNR